MIVTPAILPENYPDLTDKLLRIKGLFRSVQIDVCDGKLTSKPTWPYINDNQGNFEMIMNQEQGLPLWEDFDFEIDMFVKNPDQEFQKWIDAGASRIVVHHYLGQHQRTKKILDELKKRGVEGVLAFQLDSSYEEIFKYSDYYLQNIQLMGIKNIGYQGEPFDKSVLEQIKKIKDKVPESQIAVDGGVNEETASQIAEAGADRLVIGSALFGSSALKDTAVYFESL